MWAIASRALGLARCMSPSAITTGTDVALPTDQLEHVGEPSRRVAASFPEIDSRQELRGPRAVTDILDHLDQEFDARSPQVSTRSECPSGGPIPFIRITAPFRAPGPTIGIMLPGSNLSGRSGWFP